MFTCPHCDLEPLQRFKTQAGFFWGCPKCSGLATNLGTLKAMSDRGAAQSLWRQTLVSQQTHLPCPSCRQKMKLVESLQAKNLWVDVCEPCQLVWFDAEELNLFASQPATRPIDRFNKSEAEAETSKQIALAKSKALSEKSGQAPGIFSAPSNWGWKIFPAILGLVVESKNEVRRTPWVTWMTSGTIALFAILCFPRIDSIAIEWGFLPLDPFRHFGMTLLTFLILHADLFHLLGNLYLLLLFGDNVEERFGAKNFLLLFLVGGITSGFFHALFDPRPDVPLIGASGSVSAFIILYSLQFPRMRLSRFFLITWISFPAWLYLLFWMVLQSIGFLQERAGLTAVSYSGHLGGALVGLLFWTWHRFVKRDL